MSRTPSPCRPILRIRGICRSWLSSYCSLQCRVRRRHWDHVGLLAWDAAAYLAADWVVLLLAWEVAVVPA